MRVLVVDDEVKLARLLQRGLRQHGVATDLAGSGEEALVRVRATPYDAIVLDIMLPGADGFDVCRQLRAESIWTPTLMLTALSDVESRVRGLDTGADDYLAKPFSLDELLARLRAIARRGAAARPAVLQAGALRLDPSSRRAWYSDTELSLTAREFSLLETFMRHPGEVLSRFELLEHVWDDSYENRSNVIDVYVGYLRDKLDRTFGTQMFETVRGSGYRLRVDEDAG